MTTADKPTSLSSFEQQLKQSIGAENVSTALDERTNLSSDLFPPDDLTPSGLIAKPQTPEQVSDIVRLAQQHSIAITPRGGGMSYTGGYRPANEQSVLLDLRAMNQVQKIDQDNFFVLVDTGCTWEHLHTKLAGTGLRCALRGPISGSISTIGGALSQNLPGSMDAVLGLEVIKANGERFWTGSSAFKGRSAFYRNFGPDLTGLFLGDAGSLGVKTAAVLRLEHIPEGVAHASFGYDSMQQVTDAMRRIAALGLGGRVFALDPLKNKTATKVDTREGIKTLKNVVSSGKGLDGLKHAAKIALAGKRAYDHVSWSLHLTFEGVNRQAAEASLAKAKQICDENGHAIDPSIPVAMYAQSFSVRGFLGIKGERWVPLHGIFPLAQACTVVAAVESFFERHAERLAEHNIIHSFMLAANGPHFLIEPMFYWPDQILSLHRVSLDQRRLKKLTEFDDNPAARKAVSELRNELRDLLFSMGCVTTQIGRYYPYYSSLSKDTKNVLNSIKHALDPSNIMNPAALGFPSRLSHEDQS